MFPTSAAVFSRSVFRSFARLAAPQSAASYRLFDIYRFDPSKDVKPHMERYAVDVTKWDLVVIPN